MNKLDSAELNTSARMNRSSFLLISSLMLLGPLLLLSAVQASADPYYNSSETGCNGSDPNVYFCDDFEHNGSGGTPGTWWVSDVDQICVGGQGGTCTQNKGWYGNLLGPLGVPPIPAGAVRCGAGITPFGNCAAYGGNYGARSFGGGNMAYHHLKTPSCGTNGGQLCNATNNEIYVRWYAWWDAGYSFGNEKNMNITNSDGDIAFADITWECGAGSPSSSREPQVAVNYGSSNLTGSCIPPNISSIRITGGRVYFFEFHVKAGSSALIQLWVNDCGPVGGTFNCGAAPILRTSLTGSLPGNANGSQIQTVWLENWTGITSTGGGPYWDQIKASSVGPIGFAGGGPFAPTNLRVQ